VRRPRTICELSAYLAILLRSGLRSGEENDPGVFLLESPADVEREGPSPAIFLQLYSIGLDRRAPRAAAVVEAADEGREGMRVEVRRPPLWTLCRYLVGMRGRSREEEEEMAAAFLRTLHDHPVLTQENLPSLRGSGAAERYPLEVIEEREGWRLVGLSRPRLLFAFQASIPILSALADPFRHVLDREIQLEELP